MRLLYFSRKSTCRCRVTDVFSKFADLLLYLYNTSMEKIRPEKTGHFSHSVFCSQKNLENLKIFENFLVCWCFHLQPLNIWDKVFKHAPSKIWGRQPLNKWSDMVFLNRLYGFNFFRNCIENFTWPILKYFVPS